MVPFFLKNIMIRSACFVRTLEIKQFMNNGSEPFLLMDFLNNNVEEVFCFSKNRNIFKIENLT